MAAALDGSVHGAAGAAGAEAPRCADCHGDVHAVQGHDTVSSGVHWSRLATTCARCHAQERLAEGFRIPVVRPVDTYLRSVHARAVAGGRRAAVCADCHGSHGILAASDPRSALARPNVATTCGACHAGEAAAYRASVHGEALARGAREAPACTDCHGEHAILAHTEPGSPVFAGNVSRDTCGRCHQSVRLSEKYGLSAGRVATFEESYHGLALRAGQTTAANCASCHGAHDIQPARDPRSHVHAANLPQTCGQCHPGAGVSFALGPVHVLPGTGSARAIGWIRLVYLWVIGLVIGGMVAHNLVDLVCKARRPLRPPAGLGAERMSRALRWQHGLVVVSFPTLVYTGFALTYPEAWWAAPLLRWEGQLGLRGSLHRAATVVLVTALAWHGIHVATSPRLRACFAAVLWSRRDLRDLVTALARALGRRAGPAHGGTFTYVEKAEYWAFLWGTGIMAATGLVLWFENPVLRWLPKWVTDIAVAVHFYEAVLATLAIVVWHLYWVMLDPDVYPMDGSWWHGREPAARSEERHPE